VLAERSARRPGMSAFLQAVLLFSYQQLDDSDER